MDKRRRAQPCHESAEIFFSEFSCASKQDGTSHVSAAILTGGNKWQISKLCYFSNRRSVTHLL
jgi:hypothetical protein